MHDIRCYVCCYDNTTTVLPTTRVSRYQKKHSPTQDPDHHPIFVSFFHLPRSIASSLFKLRSWQSFCTTSLHVVFGLPLGLEPSTSYSIHFFTQSVSSFRSTCPYHRNLFCCSSNIMASIPSLSLNSVLGTLSVFYLNIMPAVNPHKTTAVCGLFHRQHYGQFTAKLRLETHISNTGGLATSPFD